MRRANKETNGQGSANLQIANSGSNAIEIKAESILCYPNTTIGRQKIGSEATQQGRPFEFNQTDFPRILIRTIRYPEWMELETRHFRQESILKNLGWDVLSYRRTHLAQSSSGIKSYVRQTDDGSACEPRNRLLQGDSPPGRLDSSFVNLQQFVCAIFHLLVPPIQHFKPLDAFLSHSIEQSIRREGDVRPVSISPSPPFIQPHPTPPSSRHLEKAFQPTFSWTVPDSSQRLENSPHNTKQRSDILYFTKHTISQRRSLTAQRFQISVYGESI